MTNDSTMQMRMQQSKQEHEFKLALINAFAKDPELKYYAGVAAGAGVAVISSLFNPDTPTTGTTPSPNPEIPWQFLFGPGILVTNVGIAAWLYDQNADKPGSLTDTISGVVTLGASGFAGYCAAILILKAIFGEKGATGRLGALGTAGVV